MDKKLSARLADTLNRAANAGHDFVVLVPDDEFAITDAAGWEVLVLQSELVLLQPSAEYAAYRPLSPRAYWLATVKKVQKPFGAPLDDTDIDQITDYLVKTYGNEQPKK